MSYAIAQFFANGGGQAIVVRVVNRTDGPTTAATTTKFAITGGTKLEALSPGSWGNNLQLIVDTTANPDLPPDSGRFHLTVTDSPDRKEDLVKRGGGRNGAVPERLRHQDEPALHPPRPRGAVEARPRPGRSCHERRRIGARQQCDRDQHGAERRS